METKKKHRVAIIATAPFYYHTPLYRRLSADPGIDLTVYYCSDETLYGTDIARAYRVNHAKVTSNEHLLGGYHHEILKNYSPFPSITNWPFGLMSFGVWKKIGQGNYDAVILTAWTDVTRGLAFLSCLAHHIPVFFMTDNHVLSEDTNPWPKRLIKKLVLNFLFTRAAGFLAAGKANEQLYLYFKAPLKKIVPMPFSWGYEELLQKAKTLKASRDQLRSSFGIKNNEVVMLYVGRLSKEKSPITMLEAYEKLHRSNMHLFLVGDGPMRKKVEEKINSLKLTNVHLVGFKPREVLLSFYAIADIFIMPSKKDALPLAINEAMCFGLPVIVSDKVGTTVDLIRDGYNGYIFPAGDAALLTQCIKQMVNLPPHARQEFGARSQKIFSHWITSVDPASQIISLLPSKNTELFGTVTAAASSQPGKKILMVSPYLPWPLHGGTMVRIFNIIKELSLLGYEIVLLAGIEQTTPISATPLQKYCASIHTFTLAKSSSLAFKLRSLFSLAPYPVAKFETPSLKKELKELLTNQHFDFVWVNVSLLLDALPVSLVAHTPVILDHPECEELVYQDYLKEGTFVMKLFSLLNLAKLSFFHRKVFRKADAIFCVSAPEADFTKHQVPANLNVYVAPNGVDASFLTPPANVKTKPNRIVFCSNMNVRRNVDAAVWFAHAIFPSIKKRVGDAEFWIVGSSPTKEVLALGAISGITVTGTVDNIQEYYHQGKVFVAPYRFGAGTKLKVLEAMASGIPIVSTSIGCRGISGLEHRRNILIANDTDEFANYVVTLLQDHLLSYTLAQYAFELAKNTYGWQHIVANLEVIMRSTVKMRPGKKERVSFIKSLSYNPSLIKIIRFLHLKKWLRKCYYFFMKPVDGVLLVSVEGAVSKFYVRNPDELRLAESVSGTWGEQPILKKLIEVLIPGDVVYDVGANIGVYSVMLARAVGSAGKVFAFEPEQETIKGLRENLVLNKLHNVSIIDKALGNEDTTGTLYIGKIAGNISLLDLHEKDGKQAIVHIVRGDEFVRKNTMPIPKLVKVDVEGYEFSVLSGLANTLSSPQCKVLCVEMHPYLFPKGVTEEMILWNIKSCGFSKIDMFRSAMSPYPYHLIAYKP
jgi:FkbM family methyltransferase